MSPFALMGNHYHLLIQTPEANLSAGMKWLQNTITRRYPNFQTPISPNFSDPRTRGYASGSFLSAGD